MNQQLHLTALELKDLGFQQEITQVNNTEEYPEKAKYNVIYKIPDNTNGYFCYNPLQEIYAWYHHTEIAVNGYTVRNAVHLNIKTKEDILKLLEIWGVTK